MSIINKKNQEKLDLNFIITRILNNISSNIFEREWITNSEKKKKKKWKRKRRLGGYAPRKFNNQQKNQEKIDLNFIFTRIFNKTSSEEYIHQC